MITVFPAASSNAQEKRLVTEYNICNIVNRLVDRKAFVISVDNETNPTTVEFNIGGYFFRCDDVEGNILSEITDAMKDAYTNDTGNDDFTYPIYAYIETKSSAENIQWTYLPVSNSGDDTQAEQAGLKFTLDAKTAKSYKNYLYLIDYQDGNWYIPAESWIRFNQNSIFIDDGDLDKK